MERKGTVAQVLGPVVDVAFEKGELPRIREALTVRVGEAVAQGVFVEYGITVDDDASAPREGGFGSTGR